MGLVGYLHLLKAMKTLFLENWVALKRAVWVDGYSPRGSSAFIAGPGMAGISAWESLTRGPQEPTFASRGRREEEEENGEPWGRDRKGQT